MNCCLDAKILLWYLTLYSVYHRNLIGCGVRQQDTDIIIPFLLPHLRTWLSDAKCSNDGKLGKKVLCSWKIFWGSTTQPNVYSFVLLIGNQRDSSSSCCASGGKKLSGVGGFPLPEQVRYWQVVDLFLFSMKRITLSVSFVWLAKKHLTFNTICR